MSKLENKEAWRRLWTYVRPHGGGLACSIGAFTLAALTEPLIPALLKTVLDQGFAAESRVPLWSIPLALIALFALRGLFSFLGIYLLGRTTSRTVLQMRTDLMAAVARGDPAVFGQLPSGTLAARTVSDPQNVVHHLGGAATTFLRDGVTAMVMVGYLFYLNWALTLMSLVTIPVLALSVRAIHRRIRSLSHLTYESQLRLLGVAEDISRAWKVIRTFDAVDWEKERFRREAAQLQRLTLKNISSGALMTPISQVVASVGLALVLTLALVQARDNSATVGEFVAFITAMLLLVSKARHLTDLAQPVANGLTAARACFEIMDLRAEDDTGTRTLDRCSGELRLSQVVLRYPGNSSPAIDHLDLHVRSGETLALVGASGSGKTTLIDALLGFMPVESGSISLDGIDTRELRKTSLREQYAVVSQDTILFDGTLADNVAYARPLDLDRVEHCLKAANLWTFVSTQPEGAQLPIGTNGSRLSGGQRQRLAIARALYKDAPVWIFDEATSALDTESERAVQEAIDQWQGRKTLILIAHRLSTVRNADWICVLSSGRVIERGRHADLLASGGAYASMVMAQGS